MFKKTLSKANLEKLEFDNKLLEYELLKIKNTHPELFDSFTDIPDIVFAIAVTHSKTKLITTPFIEISTFLKILLFVWLSGCSAGIAIFLLTFEDFWIRLTAWPAIGVMLIFLIAAFGCYIGETTSSKKATTNLFEKHDDTTESNCCS